MFKLISYYLIILFGLIMTSWLIWSRFIRERTIRDVPDGLFTEYRFWILLYLCFIYLFIIKNLIKPKQPNPLLLFMAETFYIPIITFDHAIKYNKFIKPIYDKFIIKFIKHFCTLSRNQLIGLIYILQIIPRIILVSFLSLDVFYFNKLELFYKVILIGIFPLLFRYLNYMLKDTLEYWIKELHQYYRRVTVYEEGHEYEIDREDNTLAIYHNKDKSLQQYIDIKYENSLLFLYDKIEYEYTAYVFCTEDHYIQYQIEKYSNTTTRFSSQDYADMKKLFNTLLPLIIDLKRYLEGFSEIKEEYYIKYSKIAIFSCYLICWAFVLIICYICYPVEFHLFIYFIRNIMLYLIRCSYDPFNQSLYYSLNTNFVTIENIKLILTYIWERLTRQKR